MSVSDYSYLLCKLSKVAEEEEGNMLKKDKKLRKADKIRHKDGGMPKEEVEECGRRGEINKDAVGVGLGGVNVRMERQDCSRRG